MKIPSINKSYSFYLLILIILSSCTVNAITFRDRPMEGGVDKPVLPITGTWINLVYQDVRNKYTNPSYLDMTLPEIWEEKVAELAGMGMEYLVFMAVANDQKAYYPSRLMPWAFAATNISPVCAIMDAAEKHGLKVFMSSGWAKDQDDDLRDPAIKQRQLDMMTELAEIYGQHPAFYGWYLPVEDCLCPILSDHAVEAANILTRKARALTPGKKILISPYGIVNSDFDDPLYAERLAQLEVDIIAYQDEIGCLKETFPLPQLRKNWKKLRAIHDQLNIELWANCETFTWEKGTNDRSSALLPAAYPRLLAQQVAASNAGAERIISFMFCGIIEDPSSTYQLGQPLWSNKLYEDYTAWKSGERRWALLERSFRGKVMGCNAQGYRTDNPAWQPLLDGMFAEENSKHTNWVKFPAGDQSIVIHLNQDIKVEEVFLRLLNYQPKKIAPPSKIALSVSEDGEYYQLVAIKDVPSFANAKHDAWVDGVLFDNIAHQTKYLKIDFQSSHPVYIDEVLINPILL